ncbi:PTS system D-fructose-specific IIA component (F1P-forming), Frc family (TC 4.A.2.1.4)/PTS system D-fructose-specific IIB component (F1P-forming), Frc family (TC 4.A.2.1.4)/PTS system D-fructose-specific IIC component (F1P-forming), Frc family (TC 4.A.2.1.4) [Brevinema andersonii]|uniref:PTS system, fructose-specific IIC component n=1 Tax=Brevinema andersonii TaxID=34097 RepID=A0A1I1F8Y1_BREAD|nr:fructose-specific PTS transporter subunit EIIC [Brevinema andersonii]SFB93603.1 PTS system D-fructose-specific IIA component (F1P-forming), Frc family (TC 4.A.2.1.4)/PTS system D-fructose-specific IIB component (F1P-forming), Frc family (TC 4.A.2.1.4)/PTS system D-fructose-specific IIC component (F1P-forming), Frc family (TC 4.A.2.1.4) [Brevinema andersonii]
MKFLNNLLVLDNIVVPMKNNNKSQILNELAERFVQSGNAHDKQELYNHLQEREHKDPTIVEENIAVPHAKCVCIDKAGLVVGITKEPVVWNEETQETVRLIFMIGVPENENNLHIEILQTLGTILNDEYLVKKLLNASDSQAVWDVFKNLPDLSESDTDGWKSFDIVAVTACPTGIAHTYMAADALKKSAQKQNLTIKVETNGADGPKNILSDQEIKNAKVVIVASDRDLDLSRFNNKMMYSTSAGNAVRKADEVIEQALTHGKLYTAKDNTPLGETKKGVYGQLMTGVSYMLPFVVGGGILIALSFLFGINASDPNSPDFNPIAQFFHILGAQGAFALMVPVMAGYIGFGIAERPALMPAMVGGYLAVNSGGGFLGGLLAGFIGGYSIVLLKKVFSLLPKQLDGLKPVLFYPVFSLLLTGIVLLPILSYVSAINSGVNNFLNSMSSGNLVLLGALLAGMMAVDMGGPVNKAAFTFGIAAIQAGNNLPHAAVMAGGMVPPLGIALATTFFRKKFTPAERESGLTCYIMGACFITESAIPFAVSDPIRIIPACIIGSAVAGALSMFFGCELPAPHGGIFVFPLVKHVFMYIISILVGCIITGGIIGMMKNKIKEPVI